MFWRKKKQPDKPKQGQQEKMMIVSQPYSTKVVQDWELFLQTPTQVGVDEQGRPVYVKG